MQFKVLGPLEVVDHDGSSMILGGRQSRTVLAVLLAADGRTVSTERIVDAVWEAPPPSAMSTLHSYVSRLRKQIGADLLVRDDVGYRLDIDPATADHRRFEAMAAAARTRLDAGDALGARSLLAEAERLWRGPAFVEFAGLDFASGVSTRLSQRRLTAMEDRIEADLMLGHHASAVAELTELVAEHPWRERIREQLALALYRSGRQAEALRAIADAGRALRDELGIAPGRALRELETSILSQDIALDHAAGARTAAPPGRVHDPIADLPRTALVGRASELAQLVDALDDSQRSPRFVVVEGEPGVGKTRLLDELRSIATARGALAVWGRSDEGGAAPALWPWLAPLRTLAEHAPEVPPRLAELLDGDTPAVTGSARSTQYERFEATADLLADVARDRRVVLLLDDLQWVDATSLELLAFLCSRVGAGVLVVATMRQLEVGRNDAVTDALATLARQPGSRRVQLRGLTRDATAAMLDEVSNGSVNPAVATAIHARADGNPFYAVELVRLLDEEGGLGNEVPRGVGDVILRRIARLPAATVALLHVAAVVGRDARVDLLASAAGASLDAVLDELEPAVAHRLLMAGVDRPGVLRFSHALVREVLLDDMSSLRRARLHLKVADAIEAAGAGVDDVEILAEHLWRAAPVGVGLRAAAALEQAAEVALRRVAYAAAEDHLTRAVQLRRATGTPADQEAELLAIYRLLEVARALRYFHSALTSLSILDRAKELAERCGRRDLLVHLLWFEWSALATSCAISEARRLAGVYRSITDDDPDPEVRASGYSIDAVWHWISGRIDEAAERFAVADALLVGVPMPEGSLAAEQRMVGQMFSWINQSMHGTMTGDAVLAAFDRLIADVPDRFAVASACGFAGVNAVALGRWDDVERYGALSLANDPTSQFEYWAAVGLMHRGIGAAWRGDLVEGVRTFAEGKARYTSVGGRVGLVSFQVSIALGLLHHHDVGEADGWLQAARHDYETDGERWNEPVLLIGEAELAAARGDRDGAAAALGAAIALARGHGSHAIAERAVRAAADLDLEIGSACADDEP